MDEIVCGRGGHWCNLFQKFLVCKRFWGATKCLFAPSDWIGNRRVNGAGRSFEEVSTSLKILRRPNIISYESCVLVGERTKGFMSADDRDGEISGIIQVAFSHTHTYPRFSRIDTSPEMGDVRSIGVPNILTFSLVVSRRLTCSLEDPANRSGRGHDDGVFENRLRADVLNDFSYRGASS